LYKMANLWLGFREDLGRCIAEELLKGSRQVRLIEVPCFEDRIEDRDSVPQQRRRFDGALVLADMALRLAGRLQEAMPHSTWREGEWLIL